MAEVEEKPTVVEDLIVFVGPSGAGLHNTGGEGIRCRPPIRAGDLRALLADSHEPRDVLIVDGEFSGALALTVAEIRETIAAGLRVFGSTSMGAIRAVEATPVGMRGVGPIHRMILSGDIVSDSDLALSYLSDYRPLSVPLVNMRLLCGMLHGLGGDHVAIERFETICAQVYFPHRTFDALHRLAAEIDPSLGHLVEVMCTLERRPSWDLKALDAVIAVQEVKVARDASLPTMPVSGSTAPLAETATSGSVDGMRTAVPATWFRLLADGPR